MLVKRSEIWLADLNPRKGSEPGALRPVLIIQSDLLNNAMHPSTIVCPLTSTTLGNVEVLRVNIPDLTLKGQKGYDVLVDHVRAIDNKRLISKIGDIPETLTERVVKNLAIILDLD